ncbi:MAG: hypothetical protein P0Y55_08415 [Candidatus Cohnella colombiensis]|uniref:Uncharacterized protein n=1 Tax=Candidatus Cohnella colombiensis TaxID=3121368 RepID=A0AA95F0L1_9BACL|nr:MAG: hypothetical protein P0Y55_08415 [Cohnella sp.]
MKLIIVEGIPGSGKSSMARFIAIQLERNGYKTRLLHESTLQHPILIEEEITNVVDWRTAFLSNWIKFLEDRKNESDEIIVMESVLFQSPIIKLLHLDIERNFIAEFIEQLYALLAKIDCSLIYLYQSDPSVGIHRMMESRGGEVWLNHTYEKYKDEPYYKNRGQQGKELHLDFLHDYSVIAEVAYSKSNLCSIKIDNTAWEWGKYQNNILKFLNLSHKPDPVISVKELEKFIGIYHNEEMGITIQIEIKNNELIIFNNYILKPRENNKFYLDNISLSLEYIVDNDGEYSALIIFEKDIVGNRNEDGTRFERVT